MKLALFTFSLFFMVLAAFGAVADQQGSIPNFLDYVGKALPGRCYLASDFNKKIAAVLMVSFEDNGFQVAPFDIERTRVDYFDNMSYEDVLKNHPITEKMFLDVSQSIEGAMIEEDQGGDSYRGEMREVNGHIILRTYLNNKLYKYCDYFKAN